MRGTGLLTMVLVVHLGLPADAQQGAFDDLPVGDAARRSVPGSHADAGRKIQENIRVEASFDRATCYPFEQVLLTYRLYTALQSNSMVAVRPSLEGFISRELPQDGGAPAEKTIGGKTYRVFTVWRVRLTALQPGSYTIGPLTVSNEISYTAADGGVGHYQGPVSSSVAHIRVLPLPAAGQPAGFMGPVGQWAVSSRVTASRPATGEGDTLLVEMTGQGSFEALTVPDIRWPDGLRHYKPAEKWMVREDGYPQSGKKIFAIPFSGKLPGKYVLPVVAVTYFDPVVGVYRTVESRELSVQVGGDMVEAGAVSAEEAAKAERVLDAQVSRLLLLGSLAALVVVGVVVVVLRRKKRVAPVVVTVAPVPSASEQLADVETITDEAVYLSAMKQLLIDHLRSKLGIEGWGDPRAEEELMRLLQERDSGTAGRIGTVLDQCNRLLYAPHSVDTEVRSELSARVAAVLYE